MYFLLDFPVSACNCGQEARTQSMRKEEADLQRFFFEGGHHIAWRSEPADIRENMVAGYYLDHIFVPME